MRLVMVAIVTLIASTAQAEADFTARLHAQLQKQPGNLFYSPMSIRMALSMAVSGARGDTASEMQRVLGLSDKAHEENAALLDVSREQPRVCAGAYRVTPIAHVRHRRTGAVGVEHDARRGAAWHGEEQKNPAASGVLPGDVTAHDQRKPYFRRELDQLAVLRAKGCQHGGFGVDLEHTAYLGKARVKTESPAARPSNHGYRTAIEDGARALAASSLE